MIWFSNVLANLGFIAQPLQPRKSRNPTVVDAKTGVSLEWQSWCQRWFDTSTLSPKTKKQTYYNILKVGRWLFQKHPDILSPQQWNRDLAIDFVATINKLLIGEYVVSTAGLSGKLNKPASPRHKESLLCSTRRFFMPWRSY